MPQHFKRLASVIVMGALVGGMSAQQPLRAQAMGIVDSHAHIRLAENDWSGTPQHPKGVAALVADSKRHGISRIGLVVIAGGGPDATRQRNDALLAAVAAAPDLLFPIASVHPADGPSALAELERLQKMGVRRIKLHPNSQEFDVSDPAVAAVTARAGELGLSILIDCFNPFDPAQFGKIMRLALTQPNTKFILAHMNFVDFRQTATVGLLRRKGVGQNIYFDLSVIATTYANSPVREELLWTIRHIGVDRFLFGSDWPNDSQEEALAALRSLGFTPAELDQLLRETSLAIDAG